MRTGAWRPVLGGAIAKEALDAVGAIAEAIGGRPAVASPKGNRSGIARGGASLAGGSAGLAIFFAYLSRSSGYRDATRSLRFLGHAGSAVASVTMGPSLYGGFTGVAWALAHLREETFDLGRVGSAEAADHALNGYLGGRTDWRGDYDLISGLVGLGVYALERLPAPTALTCLRSVVDRLSEIAERRPVGRITWRTPARLLDSKLRARYPRGFYNLGVAHGIPGVIVLLSAAWAAGVRRRKARVLLDGAVSWLLDQRRRNRNGSLFPPRVGSNVEAEGSRSAWCYGDPGVSAALFVAARCVGEPEWEREALRIARRAATRPTEEAGVVDAGLCHGAAGLAHVFNRMYQASGDATLRRAARFWFRRTLAMRIPGRGIGGFSALAVKEDGTRYWEEDPGILTGAAGIGLALLAAATSIEPAWDHMLLLSAPGQR